MVFSSLEFIFLFLPIVLLIYYIIPKKYIKFRNLFLCISSIVFYAWSEPSNIIYMVFLIVINYICALLIEKNKKNLRVAKILLVIGISFSLSFLLYFKYSGFLLDSCGSFLRIIGVNDTLFYKVKIESKLPIGISFYTFQAISYIIDVYRGDKATKNILEFSFYVTFFPQLIAGPIVRFSDIYDKLKNRKESIALFSRGIRYFILGLSKKVLLANNIGLMWDYYKNVPCDNRTFIGCWFGIIAFTFQIYFDFSGYCDMAIGMGYMFGFDLPINFNYPYISKSITEYWRRWHISLSRWFRDYVYISLGGNRCTKIKGIRNLLVVWFLTGLWHGASVNFIIWGLYFCIIIILEKNVLVKFKDRIMGVFKHIYTMFLVSFGWFIFSYNEIDNGFDYMANMFFIDTKFISISDIYDINRNMIFIIILLISSIPVRKIVSKYYNKEITYNKVILDRLVSLALYVLCIIYMVSSSYNPFLYFRF